RRIAVLLDGAHQVGELRTMELVRRIPNTQPSKGHGSSPSLRCETRIVTLKCGRRLQLQASVTHMKIGILGLGRLGGNTARRLMKAGHSCVVYDANPQAGATLAHEGAAAAKSLAAVVEQLGETPRSVWVMLPAGKITEETIRELAG